MRGPTGLLGPGGRSGCLGVSTTTLCALGREHTTPTIGRVPNRRAVWTCPKYRDRRRNVPRTVR